MNDDDVQEPWYTISDGDIVRHLIRCSEGRLGEEFNRYQEPMQPKYNIKKHLLLDNQVLVNSYYSNKYFQYYSVNRFNRSL